MRIRIATLAAALVAMTLAIPALRAETRASAPKKVALKVEGWNCGGCAHGTKAALEKLPGVKTAQVRFATKHCFVWFDPAKQSPKSLIRAIEEKPGLKASVDAKASWPKSEGTKKNGKKDGGKK